MRKIHCKVYHSNLSEYVHIVVDRPRRKEDSGFRNGGRTTRIVESRDQAEEGSLGNLERGDKPWRKRALGSDDGGG
jgi:hypothetical protein